MRDIDAKLGAVVGAAELVLPPPDDVAGSFSAATSSSLHLDRLGRGIFGIAPVALRLMETGCVGGCVAPLAEAGAEEANVVVATLFPVVGVVR